MRDGYQYARQSIPENSMSVEKMLVVVMKGFHLCYLQKSVSPLILHALSG